MKTNKGRIHPHNNGKNNFPDEEMFLNLKKKGYTDNDLKEYERLTSYLRYNYSAAGYSFGPHFSDLVIKRVSNLSGNHLILDLAEDLSQFFTRVAAFAFFVFLLMVLYSYVTQGDVGGIIKIDPEKLNDSRLFTSILFN